MSNLVRLADLLRGVTVAAEKASQPVQKSTPRPERQKVASKTPRDPINRQAALIVAPMRCWLSQPPHEKPGAPDNPEMVARIVELQNQSGALAAEIGLLRAKLKEIVTPYNEALDKITALRAENRALKVALEKAEQRLALALKL